MRDRMARLAVFGPLYDMFKDGLHDTARLEDEIQALMVDDDVQQQGHLHLRL